MRRCRRFVVALALGFAAFGYARSPAPQAAISARGAQRSNVDAYRGLGTWVDVYHYVPAFQNAGKKPTVTPASVDVMKRHGVRTLYLQAAQEDRRSPGATVTPRLLGQFLRRAHDAGLRVVAWYLPHFADVNADVRHVRGLLDFEANGERFDGVALDLEFRGDVPDPDQRSAALVQLSRRVRDAAGARPVGAIVLEPVLLEVVNGNFWPSFPWRDITGFYDVWLPMSYWTNRSSASGYQDGFRYTDENIRRLRNDLGNANVPVHAIGGVAGTARAQDVDGFVRAAKQAGAIGWSLYSFDGTARTLWPPLGGR
jgi:uncharacterized lipoprotein YddW (UPF0748 family)